MLFMGQEFSASSPFLYFADHEPELAAMVSQGRRDFMSQFPGLAGPDADSLLCDPAAPDTFAACKLDWNQRDQNVAALELHHDLIRLRREDAVFSRQDKRQIEAAVIGSEAFVLRWYDDHGDDRVAVFNLGRTVDWYPMAEPLLAPPTGRQWQLLWSSEDPRYGGMGTPKSDAKYWRIASHAALVFHAVTT
jgi:maltooligosyltrehalose trehalohydrolase